MKCYFLQVFCGGIPVSISAVKNERIFFHTVSRVLHNTLVGAMFTMKIYDGGITVESGNITDKFLESTIPFVYQNRKLELRVYPETFDV
jgi:hypothetical protein